MSSFGSLEFDSVLNNRGTVGTDRSKNLRPRFGGPEESRGPPVSSVDISGPRSDIRSDFTNLQIVIHRHRIPDCFWLHLILKLSLSPLYFPREIPCFGNEAQSAHKERLRQLIFPAPCREAPILIPVKPLPCCRERQRFPGAGSFGIRTAWCPQIRSGVHSPGFIFRNA